MFAHIIVFTYCTRVESPLKKKRKVISDNKLILRATVKSCAYSTGWNFEGLSVIFTKSDLSTVTMRSYLSICNFCFSLCSLGLKKVKEQPLNIVNVNEHLIFWKFFSGTLFHHCKNIRFIDKVYIFETRILAHVVIFIHYTEGRSMRLSIVTPSNDRNALHVIILQTDSGILWRGEEGNSHYFQSDVCTKMSEFRLVLIKINHLILSNYTQVLINL